MFKNSFRYPGVPRELVAQVEACYKDIPEATPRVSRVRFLVGVAGRCLVEFGSGMSGVPMVSSESAGQSTPDDTVSGIQADSRDF